MTTGQAAKVIMQFNSFQAFSKINLHSIDSIWF